MQPPPISETYVPPTSPEQDTTTPTPSLFEALVEGFQGTPLEDDLKAALDAAGTSSGDYERYGFVDYAKTGYPVGGNREGVEAPVIAVLERGLDQGNLVEVKLSTLLNGAKTRLSPDERIVVDPNTTNTGTAGADPKNRALVNLMPTSYGSVVFTPEGQHVGYKIGLGADGGRYDEYVFVPPSALALRQHGQEGHQKNISINDLLPSSQNQ